MSLSQTIQTDLDAIFSNDFVKPAQHTNGPVNETLNVLFDQTREILLSGDMPISTKRPVITLKSTDTGNINQSSQFVINAQTYFVLEIYPDDNGIKEIVLTQDAGG